MNTITTLHQLGLIALCLLIALGLAILLLSKSGNVKEEAEIIRLQDEVNKAKPGRAKALEIAYQISQINSDVLDNERYRMYEKLIKSFNQKFAKVHTI